MSTEMRSARWWPWLSLVLALFAGVAGCESRMPSDPPAAPLVSAGGTRVLFVGNSLTFANNLPRTVADLARLSGDTIDAVTAAEPNFALLEHLKGRSDALRLLQTQRWDFVILQQGPSSLRANADSLRIWTGMFDPLIRQSGARTALLMVWPSSDRYDFFDAVLESYLLAARSVNGIFIPAGQAWRQAWYVNSVLPFWDLDGYHPAPLGTYLAALTVYERITGKDARALSGRAVVDGRELNVDESTVRLLQRAAHEANTRWPQ